MDIRRAIRNALGGGNDVTVLNPLPVTHVLGNPPYAAQCLDITIPAGTTYLVSSGDVWGVLALVVEAGRSSASTGKSTAGMMLPAPVLSPVMAI